MFVFEELCDRTYCVSTKFLPLTSPPTTTTHLLNKEKQKTISEGTHTFYTVELTWVKQSGLRV